MACTWVNPQAAWSNPVLKRLDEVNLVFGNNHLAPTKETN